MSQASPSADFASPVWPSSLQSVHTAVCRGFQYRIFCRRGTRIGIGSRNKRLQIVLVFFKEHLKVIPGFRSRYPMKLHLNHFVVASLLFAGCCRAVSVGVNDAKRSIGHMQILSLSSPSLAKISILLFSRLEAAAHEKKTEGPKNQAA